ncbi:hypothetical protein TIFTF001_041802 [Ficus carica]|uniref:Uncharacterized protein n=1 Tax=Ficus carica TaxID=3494 RepID=A0AA87ZTI0_FICCA|nr:hypothetical protein TIFTF001_041802 [Ficus carica]
MASKFINLLFLYVFLLETQGSLSKSWIKAGYYSSQTELPVSDINSALFTHLIFGFVYVNSSSYQLSLNSSDSQKFSTFTSLVKRKNPSVTTILSIFVSGEQSSIFFSKLNQSSYRKSFIESSIRTARLNGFQGLDLHDVKPSTRSDVESLRTLLADWRAAIDSEAQSKNQQRLLLVMLAHHTPVLDTVTYPIDTMNKSLDWVHVKSYNYYIPTETNVTYPHAALYDPSNKAINTNHGIQEWKNRGFPTSKLILGLPYQGFAWTLVDAKDNSIGMPASGPASTFDGSMSYDYLRWYIRNIGYGAKCVYNDTYVVNICTMRKIWINFDDVEAIRAKVSYAKKMELLGYFAFQVGNDDNWALSRAAHGNDEARQKKQRLQIIILVTTAMFILLVVTVVYFMQRRVLYWGIWKILKWPVSDNDDSNLQVFSYRTIRAATNNFSSQNKIGQGGYGPVYKGKLKKGQEIAVKRLSKTSNQGLEEFKNEVLLTAKLQHKNLVRVLGYCTEREENMLIYEYMPNKSLDLYLFDPSQQHILDWEKRVIIFEGITQGLLYLQEYSNFTIIHRDLKASNILLDNQMIPKISDFGIARIFSKDEHEANTDRIVGTLGCIPPEYVRRGIYSMKYDVYSFGVLLLQIISGKKISCMFGYNENLNLLEYAYELWKEGQEMQFFDSTLDDSSSSCKILRCMHVALLCVQENPIDRPSMLQVYSMLKSETTPVISPKKPAFAIKEDDELAKQCRTCKANAEICSVDDATISQVVPR